MRPQTNITPPRVALVDQRTGAISREWYLFLLSLFKLTGSGASSLTLEDLQQAPQYGGLEAAIEALRDSGSTDPAAIPTALPDDLTPPFVWVDSDDVAPLAQGGAGQGGAVLPFAVTVGASPFTYANATGYAADMIVQGGTVSKVEFSRDGATFYDIGAVAGMVSLSPWDSIRVTYVVAPAMTLVPR